MLLTGARYENQTRASCLGSKRTIIIRISLWSRWAESNRRPSLYESAALPSELHRQINLYGFLFLGAITHYDCKPKIPLLERDFHYNKCLFSEAIFSDFKCRFFTLFD